MSAHTPGPWRVGKFGAVYDSKGFEVADPQQVPFLHESHGGNHGHWATTEGAHVEREDEEMESNSRLIAAAPKMLDGLKLAAARPARVDGGDSVVVSTLLDIIHDATGEDFNVEAFIEAEDEAAR